MSDVRLALRLCAMLTLLSATVVAQEPTAGESNRDGRIDAAREIIAAAPFAALVTIGANGSPNVRMMDALQPDEGLIVRLGTNAVSRKVQEIRANPRVALYYTDDDGPGYVTIKGTARIVDDPTETSRHWQERWSEFYLPDRSNYVLIEVTPDVLEVVSYAHGIVSSSESWEVPAVTIGRKADPAKN